MIIHGFSLGVSSVKQLWKNNTILFDATQSYECSIITISASAVNGEFEERCKRTPNKCICFSAHSGGLSSVNILSRNGFIHVHRCCDGLYT